MSGAMVNGQGTTARPSLTARGRAVVSAIFALGLSLAIVVQIGRATEPAQATDATVPASLERTVYAVVPGDTLWDIATAIAPNEDPRSTVDLIQHLNGLSDSRLTIGQQLWLPRRAQD